MKCVTYSIKASWNEILKIIVAMKEENKSELDNSEKKWLNRQN